MSHKNDPDYHDIRATVLLEAAAHLKKYSALASCDSKTFGAGIAEAAVELRRMASNARRQHKRVLDRKRQERLGSEAKAKAFGYGD
jgi:hypothetical protein